MRFVELSDCSGIVTDAKGKTYTEEEIKALGNMSSTNTWVEILSY